MEQAPSGLAEKLLLLCLTLPLVRLRSCMVSWW
jgi:hypothetical protein